MILSSTATSERILITGATGFIGHNVLAALLRRGVACAALLRPPLTESVARLSRLLDELGVDMELAVRHGRLVFLEGDLVAALPERCPYLIHSVLHVAASTRFDPDARGEPWRTNCEGTKRLLSLAARLNVAELHLVGSAFQCGHARRAVPEAEITCPPAFHNAYEQSKWEAERLCRRWSERHGVALTVYRPSIVVGDSATARATRFGGFYLIARANEALAQPLDENAPERLRVPLRIRGRAQGRQDIVPVDYVAAMIAHAVLDHAWHERTYHLTHPNPPTNRLIKQAIERALRIGGGRFVDPDRSALTKLSDAERMFYQIGAPVRGYLLGSPSFQRHRAEQLARAAGARCPRYTQQRLGALIDYARRTRWGRRPDTTPAVPTEEAALIDRYFRHFLPNRVARSEIAQMTGLSVAMRFVLEDMRDGTWWCRFERGQLAAVRRSAAPEAEFTYTTTRAVFWEAVRGEAHPQSVFLDGRARVNGDIESALKMAMILHRFNREFPCDRQRLAEEGRQPSLTT